MCFSAKARMCTNPKRLRDWASHSGFDVTDDVKVWTVTSPIHKPTVSLVWLRPCRSLVTASIENSGDQETFIVSIVDDVFSTENDRTPAPNSGRLRPMRGCSTSSSNRSKMGVNESIGRGGAGILGDVEPNLLEVLLGKAGQPIRHLRLLGASCATARLDLLGELAT